MCECTLARNNERWWDGAARKLAFFHRAETQRWRKDDYENPLRSSACLSFARSAFKSLRRTSLPTTNKCSQGCPELFGRDVLK